LGGVPLPMMLGNTGAPEAGVVPVAQVTVVLLQKVAGFNEAVN
jgi:hypothetical protein